MPEIINNGGSLITGCAGFVPNHSKLSGKPAPIVWQAVRRWEKVCVTSENVGIGSMIILAHLQHIIGHGDITLFVRFVFSDKQDAFVEIYVAALQFPSLVRTQAAKKKSIAIIQEESGAG